MQAIPSQTAGADLADQYLAVRRYTEQLCEPLEIEDYIPQPVVDVSPPKWNIAHTTWFFEEMILKKFIVGYEVFDPQFGFLFNSYYNSIGERTSRDHRGDLSRPTVKRVFEYRKHVDEKMSDLLSGLSVNSSSVCSVVPSVQTTKHTEDTEKELKGLVILGLNHEQQHQELFLTDLKFTFSQNPLFPVYHEDFSLVETRTEGDGEFRKLDAGNNYIGFSGGGFCFDNELAVHQVFLDSFQIRDSLVTNREFMEFIDDGGYRDFRLWHSEGWDWVNQNRIDAPLYWQYTTRLSLHFVLQQDAEGTFLR